MDHLELMRRLLARAVDASPEDTKRWQDAVARVQKAAENCSDEVKEFLAWCISAYTFAPNGLDEDATGDGLLNEMDPDGTYNYHGNILTVDTIAIRTFEDNLNHFARVSDKAIEFAVRLAQIEVESRYEKDVDTGDHIHELIEEVLTGAKH